MIHFKSIVGLAAGVILTAACQSDEYHIKGEARHLPDGSVLYLTDDLNTGRRLLDSMVISNGSFSGSGLTDSTFICKLFPKGQLQQGVIFFLEPGNIYVELSAVPSHSRVSGTVINNRWQALNDSVAKYDLRIRNVVRLTNDSLNPRQLSADVNRLYKGITTHIKETAIRNKDNALGHFISTHYQGD